MGTELKIYNSLTRSKVTFKPQVPGVVKFYSCGPTTYDFLHVGNARALVVGDLFNRILKSLGYQVTFVRNYTDIDDKIIEKAKEFNRDPKEHAEIFVNECERDMEYLNLMRPDHTPKVTETMEEIIGMIQALLDKGVAYEVQGEVLYHVPGFSSYGKLSKKDLKGLQHGIRVQVEEHKKNSADFVLWKPAKENEPSWDSPWGKGRPGWHIECSAMALKFLGKSIDLHHGGVDLIFPHHENEIAQSEMANGQTFCEHWCHNEFLNFGSEKMSKSLGNVVTIRKFVETYGGPVLRQILISCHYRTRLDWSEEVIERAISDLERMHQFTAEIHQASSLGMSDNAKCSDEELKEIRKTVGDMKEELANDFNVPGALSHFFVLIRKVRREYLTDILAKKKAFPRALFNALNEVLAFVHVTLGCLYDDHERVLKDLNEARRKLTKTHDQVENGQTSVNDEALLIEQLVQQRREAKEQRNWALADEIRNRLKDKRVILQDHPDGSTSWKYE